MSRLGKAKDALAISSIASAIGGFISVILLGLLIPFVTIIVLSFGAPEYFLVALLGIAMITVVSEGALLKGIVAGAFGLMITTVGVAPMTANFRYPLHNLLYDGVSFIGVLIGLFAFAEMFKLAKEQRTIAKDGDTEMGGSVLRGVKTVFRNPITTIKSSLIGMGIGAIPGSGASVSNFVSYAEAMRSDEDSASFGDGNPKGVIASEASNSATCAGSLIPTLSFGIPGSGTTAVLLGALLMHGMRPGPDLFSSNIDITYSFLIALFIGNILIIILGLSLVTKFGIITRIDVNCIVPIIISVALFGAYALRDNPADIVTVLVFGLVGFFFVKYHYSIIALVLGVVLGPIAEANLYRSLQLSDGSLRIFLSPEQPIALIITISIFIILFYPIITPLLKKSLT
jgi:putative tricarboxylic transport membrane protein